MTWIAKDTTRIIHSVYCEWQWECWGNYGLNYFWQDNEVLIRFPIMIVLSHAPINTWAYLPLVILRVQGWPIGTAPVHLYFFHVWTLGYPFMSQALPSPVLFSEILGFLQPSWKLAVLFAHSEPWQNIRKRSHQIKLNRSNFHSNSFMLL